MEEQLGLKSYQKVNQFDNTKPIQYNNNNVVLFQIPPSVLQQQYIMKFDPQILQGFQIDLSNMEIQVFQMEKQSIGVQVCDLEMNSYITQQVVPLISTNSGLKIIKPIMKMVRVFQYFKKQGINKHSIIKNTPISYQAKKKSCRQK